MTQDTESRCGGTPDTRHPAATRSCEPPGPQEPLEKTVKTIKELKAELPDEGIDDILNDLECMMLINHLGYDGKAYRRERRQAHKKLVSEMYSPPRVTKLLSTMPDHELAPGFALDLTCIDPDDGAPWDFDVPEKREKARQM